MAYTTYHQGSASSHLVHDYQPQQQHLYPNPSSSYTFPYQQPASSQVQYPTPEMFYGDDDDSTPAVNMAGFGARNFARQQQQEDARRHAEREQQRIEEQQRARLAEERYHYAKKVSEEEQFRWNEEQQMNREKEERVRRQKEQQEWNRRQVDAQREEDKRQQQQSRTISSPLARTIPLHNYSGSISPSLRELRLQDASSSRPTSRCASDAFWPPGTRSGSGHMSSASTSSSGGSSSRSRLRPIQQTPVRRTVYEDDYEETDEMISDGFGGIKARQSTRSSYGQSELPLAKCANCGDSLPFEELVGHVCMDRFESPLLSGPPTPMLMPGTEMVRGSSAPSRSPFLEKYAQVVEKSSSPLLKTTALPLSSGPVSREWTSNKLDSSNAASNEVASKDAAKRVEELRRERIRQIEEQRAAKQIVSSKGLSSHLNESNQRFNSPKTHNSGSLSSSSMSSTKSSLLGSSMTTPSTEALTPSSSFESTKSSQSGRLQRKAEDIIRQARAERLKPSISTTPLKENELNLGRIESLLNDICDDGTTPKKVERPAPPRSSSSSGSTQRPSGLNLTLASRSQRKAKKMCSVCLQTFPKNQSMVEKDGKIFCIDDYAELYLEKCRKCTRPVRDIGVRSQDGALSGLYHRECFSCFRCNLAFEDQTFYVFENAPYCGKHYHYLNGTTCHSCKDGIEGKCRQLESGERFHPNCLTCQYDNGKEFCQDTLTDSYYVVKDKRLCEWHFEKVQNRLLKSGSSADIAEAARLKANKRMTFMQTFEARKGKA